MFEEPYKWIEAVGNRRAYLDEQFKQGSPLVALTYSEGILLLTFSGSIPKLYEIYDRIALGGMGHPADLEKLRTIVLEMAHLEGFNRSPSDVTVGRLMKFGLAPPIKEAFEEIFKAPYAIKLLLAQLGSHQKKNLFMTLDYDGVFEEYSDLATLAATKEISQRMAQYLHQTPDLASLPLPTAVQAALRAWAVGVITQRSSAQKEEAPKSGNEISYPTQTEIDALLRETCSSKNLEIALLEERQPGSSKYKYRVPGPQEIAPILKPWLDPR
jgi:proteasome alpha subunit